MKLQMIKINHTVPSQISKGTQTTTLVAGAELEMTLLDNRAVEVRNPATGEHMVIPINRVVYYVRADVPPAPAPVAEAPKKSKVTK